MPTFFHRLNSLVFWLTVGIVSGWVADTAGAQSFSRALKQVFEHLSKSSDESVKAIGEATSHLTRRTDDVAERLGQELGRGGSALSTPQALQELRRLGLSDATGNLERMLDDLRPAGRRGLVEVLEQSKRALDVGARKGMDAPSILKSLDNGGTDAFLSLRSMKSEEAIVGCLRGFDEFGEPFNEFVRKGDEAAVRALNEHWDTVRRLPRSSQYDLLANPAKYIDANGKLTRQGDELLRGSRLGGLSRAERGGWTRKGLFAGAVAAVAFALSPDWIIDTLEPLIPPALVALLRGTKWLFWWAVVLGLVWFLWPILLPVVRWIMIRLLRVLGRLPGTLGKLLTTRLEKVEATADRDFFKPRAAWKPPLRIGLLGVQRVGKSTFIVMLQKHLTRLVRGASLVPVGTEDQAALDEIAGLVSRCDPTREDQTVKLNLTWPFDRDGNPRETADDSAGRSAGVLSERLILTDFPGEWAATKANKDDRKKLIGFLKDVDGLFIVIDPTDLEDPDGECRANRQIESIQAILREDGLGLGKRFHRALAVLFTKRDALGSDIVSRLNQSASVSTRIGEQSVLDRIVALAETESLNSNESQELGQLLFDLLFPEERVALRMRLAPEVPIDRPLSLWERFKRLFRRSNHPQFAVFAISQLGRDLGQQVVQHRRRIEDWQNAGCKGDKPSVSLDLANADSLQLDLRHPFQWMFDRIPKACLYQADQLRGARGLWYRIAVHRRFRGASVVHADRLTSWARRAAILACVVIAGSITQPLADWKQRRDERHQVNQLFEDAAGKDLANDDLEGRLREARTLPTNPMPEELRQFEALLSEKMRLESLLESSRNPNRSLDDRLDDLREWLRTTADLPPMSSIPLKSLQVFQDRIASSTSEVSSEALRSTRVRSDELVRDGGFDAARTVAENLWRALDHIPGEDGTRAEARRLSEDLDDRHFQHDLRDLKERINELLAKMPPEYVKAVETVDGLWAERQKSAAMVMTLDTLRSEQTQLFRAYVEGRLDDLIREHDVNGISRLFEQLERSLRPGDPTQAWIVAQRSGLPERRVRAATAAARSDLQQGDAKAAWEKLNAVRALLIDSQQESRQEWCEISAKVRLQQQEWEHAISLFCDKDIGELAWARDGRGKAWHDWTESLEKSVPLLLTQGKTEEALQSIARHQNCQFAETCPADDRDRVGKLAAAVPQRELGLMLDEADKRVAAARRNPKELDNALQILMEARTSASRVRNEDSELLLRWRTALIDVLQKLGRHPDAVSFLRSLSNDPAFSARIPAGTKPAEGEVWDRYLQHMQETYESLKKAGQSQDAWSLLANARANVLAPEKFSKDVDEFASTRVDSRLGDLKRGVEQRLAVPDFPGARGAVDAARQELGDWAGKNSPAAERLTQLKTDIRRRELDHRLDGLKADLEEKRRRGERLEKEIAVLTKETDFSDEQRTQLSRLRDDNLTSWERDQYDKIRSAYDDRRFADLEEAVKKYAADEPFHVKRPPARLNSVKDLRNWFERFEREQNYSLTAIRLEGMPTGGIVSNYDPAAKVTVRTLKPYDVTAQENNKAGSFELRAFKTTTTFRWKKGVAIEIGLWDDEIEQKGYCMGKVALTDPYSLLYVGLPGALETVPYKNFDYAKDSAFNALKVGLTIDGMKLPPLAP